MEDYIGAPWRPVLLVGACGRPASRITVNRKRHLKVQQPPAANVLAGPRVYRTLHPDIASAAPHRHLGGVAVGGVGHRHLGGGAEGGVEHSHQHLLTDCHCD